MNKFNFILFLILCICLGIIFRGLYDINNKVNNVCSYLLSIDLYPRNPNKPLMIPNYCKTASAFVIPNQSAYVPMVYKDEESLGDYYEIDKIRDKSYFDLRKIYKKIEE